VLPSYSKIKGKFPNTITKIPPPFVENKESHKQAQNTNIATHHHHHLVKNLLLFAFVFCHFSLKVSKNSFGDKI
jgi:hypothetical protein